MTIEDRRIVRYRNGVYMFVPPCGSWLHIRSPESARYMANVVGLENVTVNYTMAADMYLSFVEKVAPSCGRIPCSICIGSWRLHVSLEDEGNPDKGIKMTPVFRITGPPGPKETVRRATVMDQSLLQSPMPYLCLTSALLMPYALLNLPNYYVSIIYHTSPWV